MTVGALIVYLVIAFFCGIFGQMLAGRSIGGFFVTTIVGLLGAMLGSAIAREIGAPEPLSLTVEGQSIPLLWAIVGSALVTVVVSAVQRSRWPRPTP